MAAAHKAAFQENGVSVASAARVPRRVPSRAGTHASRIFAAAIAASARSTRSSPAGCNSLQKKFLSDDPRGLRNGLFLERFPLLDALPVTLALPVSLLLARCRCPPDLPGLPLRPLASLLAAALAAISLARMLRTKALLAPLEQTPAASRPACCPFSPPRYLLFVVACRILGRAHGRWCSQKLRPWRGSGSSPGRNDLPSAENQHSTSRLPLQARRPIPDDFLFRLGGTRL